MKNKTLYLCLLAMISLSGIKVIAAIDDGLIGYWPLDGDAMDYSVNSNDGTVLAGASFVDNPTGDGQVLQSVLGEADTGHVKVDLPASFHPGANVVGFTTSGAFWVMFDDRESSLETTAWQSLLGQPPGLLYISRNMAQNEIGTMVKSIEHGHVTTKNTWPRSADQSVSSEGQWCHVAWTFKSHSEGGDGHFRWYIDGELSSEYTYGLQTIGTSGFRIGGNYINYPTNTKIAEVRLYDRVLTATEVAELASLEQFNPVPSYPAWWGIPAASSLEAEYANGIPAEDYSPVTLGQLKYMASKARDELDATLAAVGGAGATIDALVDGFSTSDPADYGVANLGQLKYVSAKFFDRFAQIGFTPGSAGWPAPLILDLGTPDSAPLYPWLADGTADDYAPALTGQLKHLFAWDVSPWAQLDEDANSIPDYLEALWATVPPAWLDTFVGNANADFYDPDGTIQTVDDVTPDGDYDGDGRSNFGEYLDGTDPTDFFNGESASIHVFSGDGQTAAPGDYLNMSLSVRVFDADGNKLINAPVKFATADAYAGLKVFRDVGNLSATLLRRTTVIAAQVSYRVPSVEGAYEVTASLPEGQNLTFTLYSDDSPSVAKAGIRDFVKTDNVDGTTTYTWTSDAEEGDWFHIERRREDGSWKVVHSTTYGSVELPYVSGQNTYSLTIETIP